jgi:hypothetical protein
MKIDSSLVKTTKKRITIQSAKAKGRNLQKWVCQQLSEFLKLPTGPDELISSRPMGQSGTDIVLKGEAADRFPFSVECKAQESWSIPSWIEQAKANQKPGTNWLLVCKRRNQKPVVVIDFEVFINIYFRFRRKN